jgi:serine/threonine protein kinase/tetratricopeptide (TPR) repeat protein
VFNPDRCGSFQGDPQDLGGKTAVTGDDGVDVSKSLPRTLLEQIVGVCGRFEREWRAGAKPTIEQFLPGVLDREALLQRLLLLELHLRREEGDRPSVEDYRKRFADSATLIDEVFAGQQPASEAPRDTELLPGPGATDPQSEDSCGGLSEGLPPTDGPLRPGETTMKDVIDSPAPRQRGGTGSGPTELTGDDRPGARLSLIHKHARGGVGEVWLARDHGLGREVALKRLLAAKADDPALRARFLREAWITGQLQHPGVVPVYELSPGEDGRQPYYTMRFIKGRTLAQSIREYHDRRESGTAGPSELRELVGVFLHVCQVVAFAHSRGIVHRDLKGQNVALGDFGEVMVLDWGMAKVVGEPGVSPEAADAPAVSADGARANGSAGPSPGGDWDGTDDGSILGTPSYMAPEQALGLLDQVDFRSDVYGLGAVLYELLTGEPPFRGPTLEVLRQVVGEAPLPPRQRNNEAPAALEAICLKCLSKSPEDRYGTASELAREVHRFLADEPVEAYPEPRIARVRRWVSRHRTLASVVVATLVVATACLSVATVLLMLSNLREKQATIRETRAKGRAQENLNLLRKAVDRLGRKLADDRQLKARGLEKVQREYLSEARDLYLQLPPQEEGGPRLLAERAWIDLQLARITAELGDFAGAIALASRARASFETLGRDDPAALEYREGIARTLDSLGSHHQDSHRPDEARKHLEQAVAAWERLIAEHPSSPEFRRAYAESMNRLGRIHCVVLHDPPAARGVLARSLDYCGQLVHDDSRSVEFRSAFAEANVLLGYSLATSDFKTARPLLETALAIRDQLAREDPDSFERQSDLLDACVFIASAYSNARASASVPLLYEKVRAIGERLAGEHRDVPRFAENRCLIETLYSIHLAQAGDHRRAVAAVEQALQRSPRTGLALLYAACCLSVASDAAGRDAALTGPARTNCVREYQRRAIALLREANRTGLFQQPHQLDGLKSDDPDMAPLRGTEAFRSLLSEIEESAGHP